MNIGIPREIKTREGRVAMTPAGIRTLVQHGHNVLVEKGAGLGSCIPDNAFKQAGASIIERAETVWADAEMVMKVKEPIHPEYAFLRKDLILVNTNESGGWKTGDPGRLRLSGISSRRQGHAAFRRSRCAPCASDYPRRRHSRNQCRSSGGRYGRSGNHSRHQSEEAQLSCGHLSFPCRTSYGQY